MAKEVAQEKEEEESPAKEEEKDPKERDPQEGVGIVAETTMPRTAQQRAKEKEAG